MVTVIVIMAFSPIIIILLLIRRRINYKIYNSEKGTNFKALGPFQISVTDPYRLKCELTYFYWNVKPENKKIVLINNIISAIILSYMLIVVIGNLYMKSKENIR